MALALGLAAFALRDVITPGRVADLLLTIEEVDRGAVRAEDRGGAVERAVDDGGAGARLGR